MAATRVSNLAIMLIFCKNEIYNFCKRLTYSPSLKLLWQPKCYGREIPTYEWDGCISCQPIEPHIFLYYYITN